VVIAKHRARSSNVSRQGGWRPGKVHNRRGGAPISGGKALRADFGGFVKGFHELYWVTLSMCHRVQCNEVPYCSAE